MYATCWSKQGERAFSQQMCLIKVKILPDLQRKHLFFSFFSPIISTLRLQILPAPPMVAGAAYCLPKLWNQINPGPNSVFILKLRGAVQEAGGLLPQYSVQADSSSASRVFILSCADSDRKGFSTRVEKNRVGREGNSKEVSGYWMISTVCCTPLAAGLPRHSWTHLLCMCMDPNSSAPPGSWNKKTQYGKIKFIVSVCG